MTPSFLHRLLAVFLIALGLAGGAQAAEGGREYLLGPGDIVRISVFQNPDLTTESRVSEQGTLSFPLLGAVAVGGLSPADAERLIARRLRDGGFVREPQVNVLPIQIRGSQVSVLGQVNRAGRFALEPANLRLADVLAMAGGVAPTGADIVVLIGEREGKPIRREIDLPALFSGADEGGNIALAGGDIIYVQRAPVYYIYGEVNRPGAFRLERDMSVMQALATGGGTTIRGTIRGLRVHRRGADGRVEVFEPGLDDLLKADDVIYVKESLF